MSVAASGGPVVDLRRAFGPVASSVWVVTTALDARPAGFTAISISSVSLDPPMLSFNIGRTSSTLHPLRRSGRFAVHLLGAGQQDVADRFAADADHRFTDPSLWRWAPDGLPELEGFVVRLSGRVGSLVPAGDSLVALGLVEHTQDRSSHHHPLVHHPQSRKPHLAGAAR